MDKMKKIAGSMCFLLGLIGILILLSIVMMPRHDGYNIIEVEKKLDFFSKEKENTIDVIILGDSETYSAFIPLQLWKEQGITSYVCGTHAQRLCDTVSILKTSLETQSPKMVVLETNCLFRYAGVKVQTEDMTLHEVSKVLPVFKFHNRWKQVVSMLDESERKKLEREHLRKGFKLRKDCIPYTGGEWMYQTEDREEFGDLVEEYLMEVYEICKSNEIELLLVTTPAPDNWSYAKYNTVNDWAVSKGLTYLDMNFEHTKMQIDWDADTRDAGDHLNFKGAKKLSAYFGDYLKENFELADHRKEEAYRSWDEAVDKSGMEL